MILVPKNAMVMAVLVLIFFTSALAVIYSKFISRDQFIEIQRLEREMDRFEVEWGQLQLELTTLTEQSRIERLAQSKLGLVLPKREQIIYIKP